VLLLDTDIASAFAKAGHFKLLLRLFERPGITPAVYEELLPPLEHGHDYPHEIFESVELVTLSDEEQREYLKLRRGGLRLGKGELESICVYESWFSLFFIRYASAGRGEGSWCGDYHQWCYFSRIAGSWYCDKGGDSERG